MSIPFAQQLVEKQKNDHHIAVITPALVPLLERSSLPFEIWPLQKSERKELYRKLKREKVDQVIFLTNSLGSFWPYALARVPKRVGFKLKWTSCLLTETAQYDKNLPQGQRNLLLLNSNPINLKPPFLIDRNNQQKPSKQLLIFPGAQYGPSKQWSNESYAEIIGLACENNLDVNLMGTAKDKVIADKIVNLIGAKQVTNLCGKGDLNDLLENLSDFDSSIALCNDSGAMHLLAACNIPVLGLYFSTSAKNTPPAFGPYQVIEADIECRPCYDRSCRFDHFQCRSKITVQHVWEQLKLLMEN